MNFDHIAPIYRALETLAFGNSLQTARTIFLPQVRDRRRALIVGEGNGRFLAELLRANPTIAIDCVDSSAKMLALAAKVIPSEAEGSRGSHLKGFATESLGFARDDWQFHHADIRDWQPDRVGYDLIVTHFFLDCFAQEDLPRVIEKIASSAAPGSSWLMSDFAIPSRGSRKLHAQMWLRAMYSFFRFAANLEARELIDPSPFLRAAGFELREEKRARFGMIKAQRWQRDLHAATAL